jgi:integrase
VTYQSAFKHNIKPHLGSKRLNKIKRKHIRELIETLKAKKLGSGRIQTVLAVLSGIFNLAIDDELLTANPATRQGKHVKNKPKKGINPLTADEIPVLFENALAQETIPVLVTLYLLLVRTGMRIGEALALEWADIDFDERTAEITKTWQYHTRTIGLPKNGKDRRIDLSPMVIEALKELRKEEKIVSITGSQIIFTDWRGERLKHSVVYRTLQKVSPRPIRIHDLRHTYATLRVAKGDNIVDVSNQLGHHDPGFTLKRYAHWIPGEHKAQVDDLDNVAPIRIFNAESP